MQARTLREVATSHLRDSHGLAVTNSGPDHLLLKGEWGKLHTYVMVVPRLTRGNVGAVVQRAREADEAKVLLVSERITEELASHLRDAEVLYVDRAGNLLIKGDGIHIEVQGKRLDPAAESGEERSSLTAVFKLIYVLLQQRGKIRRPYRELAEAAGISLGSVGSAIPYLEESGYVRTRGRQRTLLDPEGLHRMWEARYGDTLRAKLGARRFRTVVPRSTLEEVEVAVRKSPGGTVLVGGEYAAAQITGGFQPSTIALHTSLSMEGFAESLNLVRDPGGPIAWVGMIGKATAWEKSPWMVDPLLVRAELLLLRAVRHAGAATQLLEKHIRPRWTA